MNDYVVMLLTALVTGVGIGAGTAIGTYFANKALIKNWERIAIAIANSKKKDDGDKCSPPP